jgi:hypothetical protein
MPAKAGIQKNLKALDSRLRGCVTIRHPGQVQRSETRAGIQ